MMRRRCPGFAGLLALGWIVALAWAVPTWSTERTASYLAALESISTEELQHHVDFLAHDDREGREAGSRGGHAAGDYLREQLTVLDLAGAGTDGAYVQAFSPNFRNILALLEGGDPQQRREVIVVGAHYDHVGFGRKGSASGEGGVVHPGADDNASGTSGVLELAQAFSLLAERPRRTILFAFWDAEEKGMLGAKHWVAHPTLPLERVKLLVNLDMIGRLREDRLSVYGTRTASGLRRLASTHNESGLHLEFPWALIANADHYPFFARDIPFVALHTGLHEQYHRPGDKAPLIDAAGMRRVMRLLFAMVYELANQQETPALRAAARHENDEVRRSLTQQAPQITDRLGASWEGGPDSDGRVRLTRVLADSPAHKAGLRPGDRIAQFAGQEIRAADALTGAVMTAPVQTVALVERPGEPKPIELKIELDGKPLRVGIMWRVDEAEPRTAILTYVVPGSPAARAGLQADDRIYQVNGRDFADDEELLKLLGTLPSPIRLRVERNGQVRTVDLQLQPMPVRRAA